MSETEDKKMRVTRRDVARAAGVSLTTVTHALNDTPGTRIQAQTREAVLAAARKLGYRPSFLGQALSRGETGIFGLLLPRPEHIQYELYTHIMHALAKDMEQDGKHLLLLFRSDARRYAELIKRGALDGLFVIQSDLEQADIMFAAQSGLPTVVVNKMIDVSGYENLGSARQDHQQLGVRIINDFCSAGCRRILLYHDCSSCDANQVLQHGFDAGMAEHAGEGLFASLIRPEFGREEEQLRSLFGGQPEWDGFYCVSANIASRLALFFMREGIWPGRKLEFIYSDIMGLKAALPPDQPHAAQAQGRFLAQYGCSPAEVGHAAWQVMRKLPSPARQDRSGLVFYHSLESVL